jgi:hypothetical protein
MHLSIKVICQSPIVVQSAEIGAADITDLKFLMTRRPRRIRQRLELAFSFILCGFGLSEFEELLDR